MKHLAPGDYTLTCELSAGTNDPDGGTEFRLASITRYVQQTGRQGSFTSLYRLGPSNCCAVPRRATAPPCGVAAAAR